MRTKLLAIVALLVIASAVMIAPVAADTQAATLTATIDKTITVSVTPNALDFGTMVLLENTPIPAFTTVAGAVGGSVNSWEIVAQDNNQGADTGFMLTGTGTPLVTGLEAKVSLGGSFATLATTQPLAIVSGLTTGGSEDVYFQQNVEIGDSTGAYTISVDFIGTVLT